MITDFFIDNEILKPVPEITNPDYLMSDDGGVELQTGEFLHGLVRAMRPNNILETGTYSGISALYMAHALKENNKGKLTTLEFEPKHIQRAKELWIRAEVAEYIDEIRTNSLQFHPPVNYEIILLDTEPSIRWAELERFFPYLNEGGFIFIHDTPRNLTQGNVNPDHPEFKSWPFGDISDKFKSLVREDKLRPFHLEIARGLIGFYKVHKDDFVWK